MPKFRRRLRLILPQVQLRLIISMAGVAAIAMLLEYVLLVRSVVELAVTLPNDSAVLMEGAPRSFAWVLAASLALLLPTLTVVALTVSQRFCGPIYHFERYLEKVVAGKEHGECRLRDGDDLQSLCELINRATQPLRESQGAREASNEDQAERQRAA